MKNLFECFKLSNVSLDIVKSLIQTYFCWPFIIFWSLFLLFGVTIGKLASSHQIDNKDISNLMLTYNALVLSFSLASITLVVALPSQEFTKFLARERENKKGKINPFKNLILSFFQSAAAHYISLMLVASLFIFGPEKISVACLISSDNWISWIILVQGWAFFLFGMALKDIASLGVLYATYLSRNSQ